MGFRISAWPFRNHTSEIRNQKNIFMFKFSEIINPKSYFSFF